jgi:hypothetical protein
VDTPFEVPPVVDELVEVAPVSVAACPAAESDWALSINACAAEVVPVAGVGVGVGVGVAVCVGAGVGVGVGVVVVVVVGVGVGVGVGVAVGLPGTAEKKSTVMFTPSTLAVFCADTTDWVAAADADVPGATVSNSV